ncbi:MAG TPA: GatB/YqeY domain-containing protein [Acidimicrobiia bacterium]|nr:GatB/YqeY domain-containing protein [Acidimicrobiia bacterium]
MPIHEELTAELKDSMKARDRARLDVIRQIETEVSKAKTEPGFTGEADDALYRSVIAAYSKKMDKARDEFAALGERGAEAVAKLTFEIGYLSRWLPQGLSEDETREVVRIAIKELRANDAKQLGRVVGHIMKNGPRGVDGALVNRLVREALGT